MTGTNSRTRQLLWFVALWAIGVVVFACVVGLLRFLISLA